MAKVLGPLYSFTAHGWFPYPYPIGFRFYPASYAGMYNAKGWIYQRRRTWHGIIWVVEKYYYPYNPRTSVQQSWRGVFADAVSTWQNLTISDKDYYNKAARRRGRLSGYNLFISYYLKERR